MYKTTQSLTKKYPFKVYTAQKINISEPKNDYHLFITNSISAVERQLKHGDYLVVVDDSQWQVLYVNAFLACQKTKIRYNFKLQDMLNERLKHLLPIEEPLMLSDANRLKKEFDLLVREQGFFNWNTRVGIANSNRGQFLYSDSFGPCQAVFARLKSGEWALYHASACFEGDAFHEFISLIAKDAAEVVVVQKTENSLNKKKAPILAINLAKNLPDVLVNVITVANYRNIVLTADQVILGMEMSCNNDVDLKSAQLETSKLALCDLTSYKTIGDCVLEALVNNKYQYTVVDNGGVELSVVTIPQSLLLKENIIFPQQKQKNNILDRKKEESTYSFAFYRPVKEDLKKRTVVYEQEISHLEKSDVVNPKKAKKNAVKPCALL